MAGEFVKVLDSRSATICALFWMKNCECHPPLALPSRRKFTNTGSQFVESRFLSVLTLDPLCTACSTTSPYLRTLRYSYESADWLHLSSRKSRCKKLDWLSIYFLWVLASAWARQWLTWSPRWLWQDRMVFDFRRPQDALDLVGAGLVDGSKRREDVKAF